MKFVDKKSLIRLYVMSQKTVSVITNVGQLGQLRSALRVNARQLQRQRTDVRRTCRIN